MVFYKIEAERIMPETENSLNPRQKKNIRNSLAEKSEEFYQKSMEQTFIATVSIEDNNATFAAITKTTNNFDELFEKYINNPVFQITSYKVEEITFSQLESLLSASYIMDDGAVFDKFEIGDLNNCMHFDFGEAIIDDKLTMTDCKELAKSLIFETSLTPELDRISMGCGNNANIGHPVHYMLATDNRETRRNVYRALLSALYNNNRIKNKRYAFVDYNGESRFPGAAFDALYRASEGGAVVIRYTDEDQGQGRYANRCFEMISSLCSIATKYKNSVLTIVCVGKAANKIKESFYMNFCNTAFIELYEDVAVNSVAENYLKIKARNNKVRANKSLLSLVEPNKSYTADALNKMFDEWFSKKLRNEIYPQYKTADEVKIKVKDAKPKGFAYEKLQSLIGLDNAKEVMNQALNYFKVQKLFADKGLKKEHPSMHMVFTGNPGTAKTTVARLFAEIMKENNLISNGDLYEVGRADLVGQYVGHTAPLVKSAFKKAKGGVLFIDEAYSLVDDKDGLFGDEAINTIVQEMENNRKDTIVIFAGYPDKMEGFLNKNPGLRSRIAFHIPFDDYSADELYEIAELIANENGFSIDADAKEKLCAVFESAAKNSDFGNGRFARNVIEKAKMAQATRLINMDFDKITEKEVFTLIADDFELPAAQKQDKVIKMGFCA